MGIGYHRQIDVSVQSNTTQIFQAFLQTHDKTDITLTSDAAMGDFTINVSAGHGITAGDHLIIYKDAVQVQMAVESVSTDAVVLESPLAIAFAASETTIIRGKIQLNVNGSSAPVEFSFGIHGSNVPKIDMSAVLFVMTHAAQGDDGKFGGIAALAKGLLVHKDNGTIENLGNYKSNQKFSLLNGNVEYSDKAPSGAYGTNVKFLIQGQENFDAVIRIAYGEYIKALVRDDLTGLTSFVVSLIGSYTEGE